MSEQVCSYCDEYRKDYRIAVDGLLESRKQIDELKSTIKVKDEALTMASENCLYCGSTGLVTEHDGGRSWEEPCPKCEQIRAALAAGANQ